MAFSSHGTLLGIRSAADVGGEFTHVAEVNDISGIGRTLSAVTLRTDDQSEFPKVVGHIGDPGEMSFDLQYIGHESHVEMRTAAVTGDLLAFQVEFPTDPPETWGFDGLVTKFDMAAPVDGLIRASVTVTLASHIEVV